MAVDKEEYVPNLDVIHVTNCRLHNFLNYHTYNLVNRPQRHNGSLAARTGNYLDRMESMMKPCMFNDRDPIITRRDFDQLRSCDSNGVPEEMALWMLHKFVKICARALFNNEIVIIGVSPDACARPRTRGYKIGTYVKAGNHLSKSYATNVTFAVTTSEIYSLSEMSNDPAIMFANAVHDKAVRYEYAYSD